MTGSVAVVDVGSNSIKVLVADRGADGRIHALGTKTLDVRISAGIARETPRLSEEGMIRGLGAIQELLAYASTFSPRQISLVATSAVRDAENGREFCQRVLTATGNAIRILSGNEEANLIGRGLTCDPALDGLRDFYVFDLGGGSLECLAFQDRCVRQAVSLQLGCVRLTEAFVRVSADPVPFGIIAAVEKITAVTVQAHFKFDVSGAAAVGTGGTITTARAVLGARAGVSFDATSPVVKVTQLRDLCDELAGLSLADRQKTPGLPPARADVFPVALATLVAVANAGGFHSYQHSLYNLRFGLAAEML